MQEAGQVQRGSGEGSEGSEEGLGSFGAVRSRSTGFRKRFRGGSGDGSGRLRCEPGQVQQGSEEGSGEGLEGFGAEPRQVQINRVPEKVPEKVWEALVQRQVRFNMVSEKVPEKVWEALVQRQVKFNRVLEKVPEKIPGGFGGQGKRVLEKIPQKVGGLQPGQVPEEVWEALQCQVQQGSGEGFGEGLGSCGAEPGQVQQDLRI